MLFESYYNFVSQWLQNFKSGIISCHHSPTLFLLYSSPLPKMRSKLRLIPYQLQVFGSLELTSLVFHWCDWKEPALYALHVLPLSFKPYSLLLFKLWLTWEDLLSQGTNTLHHSRTREIDILFCGLSLFLLPWQAYHLSFHILSFLFWLY